MVKHTQPGQYLLSPYQLVPRVTIHPEIQRLPPPGAEQYLLPCVFTFSKDSKITVKYPGNGIVYINEGQVQCEDPKTPGSASMTFSAGSVVHVEKGETLYWHTQTMAKGFAVWSVPVSVKNIDVFVVRE